MADGQREKLNLKPIYILFLKNPQPRGPLTGYNDRSSEDRASSHERCSDRTSTQGTSLVQARTRRGEWCHTYHAVLATSNKTRTEGVLTSSDQ